MNTFEFKGKRYKEAPERQECNGCAFDGKCANIFDHVLAAKAASGGHCSTRRVIYIPAEDNQSKIEKAKEALKAALAALEELENGQ